MADQIDLCLIFNSSLAGQKFVSESCMRLWHGRIPIRRIRYHVGVFDRHHDQLSEQKDAERFLEKILEP
ncbi:hypothetical protein SESBI_36819 [Sesbania bispinosa]|nr:hypothetical protein SESBI_36819 [Sesbania bispinosa]